MFPLGVAGKVSNHSKVVRFIRLDGVFMKYAEVAENVKQLLDALPSQDEFIYELLLAYGSPKATISRLKTGQLNLAKESGEVLWKNKVWFKSVETDLYDFIEKMKSAKAAKTNFLSDHCIHIGTKEFEDAFADEDLLAVLDEHFQREDGTSWAVEHLPDRNLIGGKFSESLMTTIKREAEPTTRQRAKKPDFAEILALQCRTDMQTPSKIREVFELARRISGVD